MWPFGKSQAQREDEAARVAMAYTKAALDMYVPDGLLRRGVLEDYFILGYVVRRMSLAAITACRFNKVPESSAAGITEWLFATFFDDATRAIIKQRLNGTPKESLEGKEIGRGTDAATRLFNYWMGYRDIKADPAYEAAVSASRALSQNPAQTPDITSIIHAFESVTFGRYFADKIDWPSPAAMRPRTDPL